MSRVRITIEFDIEDIIDISDEDQKLWFENTIMVGDGTLKLHSEDTGDTIATIKKVSNIQYLEET